MKQVRLCLWSLVDPTPQVESVCQQLVTKAMANENHTFDNQNLEVNVIYIKKILHINSLIFSKFISDHKFSQVVFRP